MKHQQTLDNNDICKEISEEKAGKGEPNHGRSGYEHRAVQIEKRASTAA